MLSDSGELAAANACHTKLVYLDRFGVQMDETPNSRSNEQSNLAQSAEVEQS